LTAAEACSAVAAGLRAARDDAHIVEIPMADGGEGTAAALLSAWSGRWIPARVMGPLPDREIDAGFAWSEQHRHAVVEMASASGNALLDDHDKNPLLTTTFGTGQLVRRAVDHGAEHLWLAVGGSATVDGGVGAAAALGWRFLDEAGQEIGLGGGCLDKIARMVPPSSLSLPPIEVLCDVDNPLCGPKGAARVFGPQKGATPAMVRALEQGLVNLAVQVERHLGRDIRDLPGGGAAGGLSAGAAAFLGAQLTRGVGRIIEATGLPDDLSDAAWAITGEGQFDEGSLAGKVASGVLNAARNRGVPVCVIAGRVDLDEIAWREAGFREVLATSDPSEDAASAMHHASERLTRAARDFAETHLGPGSSRASGFREPSSCSS
jgi:glycerate kinase